MGGQSMADLLRAGLLRKIFRLQVGSTMVVPLGVDDHLRKDAQPLADLQIARRLDDQSA